MSTMGIQNLKRNKSLNSKMGLFGFWIGFIIWAGYLWLWLAFKHASFGDEFKGEPAPLEGLDWGLGFIFYYIVAGGLCGLVLINPISGLFKKWNEIKKLPLIDILGISLPSGFLLFMVIKLMLFISPRSSYF